MFFFSHEFVSCPFVSLGFVQQEEAVDPDGPAAPAVRGPRHHGVQGRDPLDRGLPRQVQRGE